MPNETIDRDRGKRIGQAMARRGHRKAMALAAELDISPAALTKWKQGHAMSLENACRLADLLDVSMDWLMLGRNAPDWLQADQLNTQEADLIDRLRRRPAHIIQLFAALLAEIPQVPPSDNVRSF
ncbi:helix-turn-helix domain-containing protein [Roseibium sp.]|uniref:helix-turn-helix domain-containing protein n=1 Tax=Roseibium sp. TaxID=1936156 RepID=UPI003A97B51C